MVKMYYKPLEKVFYVVIRVTIVFLISNTRYKLYNMSPLLTQVASNNPGK